MVRHTETTRRLKPTNCLSVFNHFVRMALKWLTYGCVFMGRMKTNFRITQDNAPLVWYRYINDVLLFLDTW